MAGEAAVLQSIDAAGCAARIRGATKLVALTGAGISTAAGIPDFRGPQGLYASGRYDPELTFTIDGFLARPSALYGLVRDVLDLVRDVAPTYTHRFLADLERRGRLRTVVTQNVDPLHQEAGSRSGVAVHGSVRTSSCLSCREQLDLAQLEARLSEREVPRCACGGVIKPDVVLYGEPVHGLEEAMAAVAASDLLLVLGSSLDVYPVAFLPECAGGDVVAVSRGPIGLAPAPNRYFADADLDTFFREVSAHLDAG